MKEVDIVVEHIYREANKLAEFFANQVFLFAGTNTLTYSEVQEIPREAKFILSMDKNQVPNLQLKSSKMRLLIIRGSNIIRNEDAN